MTTFDRTAYLDSLDELNQLRAELDKVRAQLAAVNHRADGLQADLNSATRGLNAYAQQVAELQRALAEADEVIASLRAAIDEDDESEVAR